MKKNLLLLFTLLLFISLKSFAQVNSVLTTTVGGNGQNGCAFEITAINTVDIQKLWFVADAGTGDYEIYYNPNGIGVPSSATFPNWILLAGPTTITTNGAGVLTEFPVQLNFRMNAGESVGFYVTSNTAGPNLDYTNGPFPNATIPVHPITDGNISVDINGYGAAYQFVGTVFNPRGYNGQIDYTIPSFSPDDAGIVSIDSPTVFCPGTFDVYATIKNFGFNSLTSATIEWTVDGAAQPSVNFTGNLDTIGGAGPNTAQVLLGSYPFTTNAIYDVQAWSTLPNGVADTVNNNDTSSASLQSSLPPPSNINVLAIQGDEATLGWTGGSANSWLWENVPAGNPLVGPGTPSATAQVTVTNLMSETDYDFYVREVCPTGDTSAWAGPFSYRTPFLCPPNSLCFLTGGNEGRTGPTQSQLNTVYAGTPLAGNVTSNNGIQVWTVPSSGLYKIIAYGAQGGGSVIRPGGNGAMAEGEFLLTGGTNLNIVVGQTGLISAATTPSGNRGGGGGSFVWDPNSPAQPLIAAGGGGGTNVSVTTAAQGVDGSDLTSGTQTAANVGVPGTAGNGANPGGAGFLTDGSNNATSAGTIAPQAAVNGAEGGDGYTATSHYGGFGGGGGGGGAPSTTLASGGGGGYSGGAGQTTPASAGGGGGGSFIAGNNPLAMAGVRSGAGLVIVEVLSSGALNDIGTISIDSPGVYCPGTFDVYATINNFGSNQVTSATVGWSVDGVVQAPFSFSGLLDTVGGTGSSSAQVNLGPFSFNTNNAYDIEVWTSNPNGMMDTVNQNDSIATTVQSNLPPPTGISLVSVTGNSANLSWNPGSLSNSWLWINVPAGAPISGIGNAASSPAANITGLASETAYDFYVREVCPTGDTSAWEGPFFYITPFLCPPNAFCILPGGATGQFGPTQADLNTAYSGTNLAGQVTSNNGIQVWSIQNGGLYNIQAFGAQGGGVEGGRGASVSGEFLLNSGDQIEMIVGQKGTEDDNGTGGGGGSFVVQNSNLLLAAGGGGGNNGTFNPDADGQATANGMTGTGTTQSGAGGTAGNAGVSTDRGQGGAGWLQDGPFLSQSTTDVQAFSFNNGGEGGYHTTAPGGLGGFGGGGGSWNTGFRGSGGGGGYSGGGAGYEASNNTNHNGGGAGSFNAGSNPVNTTGVRFNDGVIIFSPLSSGVANDIGISGVSPSNVVCSGDYDIIVNAVNFGISQVSSYDINWTWNGVLQTPITITNPLDTFGGSGASSAQINLGNQNIVSSNTLVVWTSNPNGTSDGLNSNDTVTVTLNPQFVSAEITSFSSGETCGAGSVTMSATFTGSQLNWYDDPGLTNLVNTGSSFTVTVSQTDTFYIEAVNTGNSCNSSVEVVLAEVNFTPTASFTQSISNCTVNFTGLVSNNTDSVRWDFGDGVGTSSMISPTYTYTSAQSFIVELTAYDGTCSSDTSKALFVNCSVGLKDNSWSESISVFPNPTKGLVTIDIPQIQESVIVSITDITGQEVYRKEFTGINKFSETLELSNLDEGMYFININSGDKSALKKLTLIK